MPQEGAASYWEHWFQWEQGRTLTGFLPGCLSREAEGG